MKIGILTFHSQLNYGGVLQCWALVNALQQMGHEVVVIDRWFDDYQSTLKGVFARRRPISFIRNWLVFITKMLLCCDNGMRLLRIWRTIRFVEQLPLSKYHFVSWSENHMMHNALDVDLIIVGSDQVWHAGDFGDPRPYLLEDAPKIPAIAYAASFGMKSLPSQIDYRAGFCRFNSISVREREGVDLVRYAGYSGDVAHVVDPTLLLAPESWRTLASENNAKNGMELVCYLIDATNMESIVALLDKWSRNSGWTVRILTNGYERGIPKSFYDLVSRYKKMFADATKRRTVFLEEGCGPKEFVRLIARSSACITDSFHAVMFSTIFNVNCRFLRPESAWRKTMFSRVEEFAAATIVEHNVKSHSSVFIQASIAAALESITKGESIEYDTKYISRQRAYSRNWLETAINATINRVHTKG